MRIQLALGMIFAAAAATAAAAAPAHPNIVWFLTDDQDQMLGGSFPTVSPGGATPLPKVQKLMVEEGTMATNFFIHTPICCPSRSEVLSGKYFHNIKAVSAPGIPTCMHVNEDLVNNKTFAKYLSERASYKVGMFGKYLNNVPNFVPVGFDAWMANGGGDYIAPSFATANVPGLPDGHYHFNISDCESHMNSQ
jgi:N-acetylglucosamine-6-sulfatase